MQTPVEVRGQLFPSLTACARHFGISVQAVSAALDAGRADFIGTRRRHYCAQPVAINGERFPSIAAASRATGIPASTLQQRVRANPTAYGA